jgi:hypothetical protein
MQAGSRGCAATTFSTRPNWPAIGSASRRRSGCACRGSGGGRGQKFLTVAAMVGLATAVLAGSAAGLLAAVVSGHVLSMALIAGVLVAIAVFAALIRFQVSTWQRAAVLPDDQ